MITEPFPVPEYKRFATERDITWPTPGGIRYHIRNSKVNGLQPALIRQGGRILIDPEKFLVWLRQGRALDTKNRPTPKSNTRPVER